MMNSLRMNGLAAATLLGMALLTNPLSACGQTPPRNNESLLSISELEKRGVAEGLLVTEIEAKGRLAEVEGRDAKSRKVKLVIDRRTGEVLERRVKSAFD